MRMSLRVSVVNSFALFFLLDALLRAAFGFEQAAGGIGRSGCRCRGRMPGIGRNGW